MAEKGQGGRGGVGVRPFYIVCVICLRLSPLRVCEHDGEAVLEEQHVVVVILS